MIIGGMIMVFGGTIMTKRRDDYDNRRDELILISESGTPAVACLRPCAGISFTSPKVDGSNLVWGTIVTNIRPREIRLWAKLGEITLHGRNL